MPYSSNIAFVKSERYPEYLRRFGTHLKALRTQKNLSQEDLAYEAELSVSQISRIERGIINTSIAQLVSIARALGVQPKTLFDFCFEWEPRDTAPTTTYEE